MSIQLRDGLANQSVDHVLEDLLVRFLANVPNEDLSSIERVFFQVEEAQWFYTDFVRQLNPYLPSMKMKLFASKILEKCPLIWKWGDPANALTRFGKYKSTIPVRGVALFNKDLTKMVLLKGTESNTWSFPRGKISKDESDIDCALREAEEETGFNASTLINEQDVVERTIKGKNYKIYLIKNVPEEFNFQPLVRNEIAKIEWHEIKTITKRIKSNPNSYFIVGTVLKPMLRWVNKNKGVQNDEELMYQAELKLKDYLGITPLAAPKQNEDAGRELLNLLQKVAPATQKDEGADNSQNLVSMHLPQHLHNQIPIYYQPPHFMPPMFHHGMPFQHAQQFAVPPPPAGLNGAQIPRMQPPHPGYPATHLTPTPPNQNMQMYSPPQLLSSPERIQDPLNQQPNPQSLRKPSVFTNRRYPEANTKELLSILNNKRKSSVAEVKSNEEVSNMESNRSKAQILMSVFNTKKDANSTNASQSILGLLNKNKIESSEDSDFGDVSEVSSQDFQGPFNPAPHNGRTDSQNATASLLSILNKTPASANVKTPIYSNQQVPQLPSPTVRSPPAQFFNHNTHQASNELEASLRRASPAGFGLTGSESGKKPTLLKRSDDTSNRKESLEILSILNKPSSKNVPKPIIQAPTQSTGLLSSSSRGLLDLLQPKKPVVQEKQPNPSMELLGLLNQNRNSSANTAAPAPSSTGVTSSAATPSHGAEDDFEDFESFDDFHDYDENGDLNNSFRNKFNFDIASDEEDVDHLLNDYPQRNHGYNASVNPPLNFFAHPEEPKKNRIRLLKPGQSLDEFQQPPQQQQQPPQPQPPQPQQLTNPHGQNLLSLLNAKKSPEADNLQSIYGSNGMFRYTE